MAVWQFRVVLLPVSPLQQRLGSIPSHIPAEIAQTTNWWRGLQPPTGFERGIDLLLPQRPPWSDNLLVWGDEDSNDAYVFYETPQKTVVEEISFRLDAREIDLHLVAGICNFARLLECVLVTGENMVIVPEQPNVLVAFLRSSAKHFVDDPENALKSIRRERLQ
ncbi:hypothetical protein Acid345_3478 [Candidatus Koribacter versatilis Ellin345]|uniref:Uncharacterized protein n=1 Tax=Koribacter versatilis (strain Ellin345) TaxID=204669 RepID=Q1IKX1_KORVE|nr:hypothetical protein [Candidatus Koribacter versatilis]ABF42479.1 hypothetical protein Acid345_3478 [Candidatus Koribacter versatilis Ellin345]